MNLEHACFHGDQLVNVNGNTMAFKDIPKTGVVMCHDGKYRPYINGGKIKSFVPMLLVTLSNGVAIRCTHDHKFLTVDGWVDAINMQDKTLCNQELLAELFKNTTVKDITCAKAQERFRRRLEKLRQNGTAAKMVLIGTRVNMKGQKTLSTVEKTLLSALSAVSPLKQAELKKLCSARKNARPLTEETQALTMRRELALSVEASLKSTSIMQQKRVEEIAPHVCRIDIEPPSDSYCLTVPDFGMFEIGGVVSSNCDALGYCIEIEFPMRKVEIAGISI